MNKYQRYSKEVRGADGSHKSLEVECVENGYIITITHMAKDEVIHKYGTSTKKYISKSKPEEILQGIQGEKIDEMSKAYEMLTKTTEVF